MPRLKVKVSAGKAKVGQSSVSKKKGRGRPCKTEASAKDKDVKSTKSFGINISAQTVRWRVVQMAWNFKTDIEVAKLLLDCYDVIVSGCLKWDIDIEKTRIPSVVSNDGWKLLEEIENAMKWKARHPMKKKLLAEWSDDEGDGIKADAGGDSDSDYHVPDGFEENSDDDGGGGRDGEMAKMSPLKMESQDSSSTKLKKKMQTGSGSGPKPKKKKSSAYPPKGYSKSGRPKKVLEFLESPAISKQFECKQCHARYPDIQEFKDHFLTHSEYVTIGNTSQHVSHISNEAIAEIAKIYINCPDCNELVSNWNVHQQKHYQQICDSCGKVFNSFSGWRRHLKYHEAMATGEKAHVCDKCGKAFILISSLTEHRKRHSKERPHTCDVCGKGFKQKPHLTRHLFVHSGVRPITCKFCGKGFTNNFNLKSHLRSHTGERPFQCTHCGKAFAHNGSLKTHMKAEHNIERLHLCQTVQEFDNFPRPKMTPGRKRGSKVNFTQIMNRGPEQSKDSDHGREVEEALLSIADRIQQNSTHEAEEKATTSEQARTDGRESPVLKALENSSYTKTLENSGYNRELRDALLHLQPLATVNATHIQIVHDNGPTGSSIAARQYSQSTESRASHPSTESVAWRTLPNEPRSGDDVKSHVTHLHSNKESSPASDDRAVVTIHQPDLMNIHHVVVGSSDIDRRDSQERIDGAYDTVEIAIPQPGTGIEGHHATAFTQWHR